MARLESVPGARATAAPPLNQDARPQAQSHTKGILNLWTAGGNESSRPEKRRCRFHTEAGSGRGARSECCLARRRTAHSNGGDCRHSKGCVCRTRQRYIHLMSLPDRHCAETQITRNFHPFSVPTSPAQGRGVGEVPEPIPEAAGAHAYRILQKKEALYHTVKNYPIKINMVAVGLQTHTPLKICKA